MRWIRWRHFEDLALDELDPFATAAAVFAKDPRFSMRKKRVTSIFSGVGLDIVLIGRQGRAILGHRPAG